MNVFILDADQRASARAHHDRHVVKMTIEACQLLSTALHLTGWASASYRATHASHPWTRWAAASQTNWWWLMDHTILLREEYLHRYPKPCNGFAFPGMCRDALRRMFEGMGGIEDEPTLEGFSASYPVGSDRRTGRLTPMPQCLPDEHKGPDVVTAYRAYYVAEKIWPKGHLARTSLGDEVTLSPNRWTNREPPTWAVAALLAGQGTTIDAG